VLALILRGVEILEFLYILLAIFIFGILIFVHELGHFIAARLSGVKILEFAIGMGPKLFGWRSKKSGTQYALRLFPIGGFVSMLGEDGMELVQGESDDDKRVTIINEVEPEEPQMDVAAETTAEKETPPPDPSAYCNQAPWRRILISLAGPAMNLILGFVLMIAIILMAGIDNAGTNRIWGFHVSYSSETEYGGMQAGDYLVGVDQKRLTSFAELEALVKNSETNRFDLTIDRLNTEGTEVERITLEDVLLNEEHLARFQTSLSETSGLCVGDEVVKVNSVPTYIANDLQYEVMMQGYRPLTITVIRDGKQMVLENITLPNEADPETGVQMGVIDFYIYPEPDFGAGTVLKHTWYRSLSNIKMVFDSLSGLFSGRYGFEAVSGPVGITKTITEMAQMGYMYVLQLVTLISINLGVMNLLPFPALDGGHLLIYAIEAIRRKPLKPEIEGIINFVGLVLILGLAVLILIKDIIAL